MIQEVTMYRVVCDEPGCEVPAQDETDYYAWADPGSAVDGAMDGEWIVRDGLHLCPEHGSRKVCMGDDEQCPRRDVTEADDGWMYCPGHIAEGTDSEAVSS